MHSIGKNGKTAALTGVSALLAAAFLTSCGKTSVDLNDYTEIDYNGYNGAGKAEFSLDLEEMIEDNPQAFGLEDDNYFQRYEIEDYLSEKIKVRFDKESSLSNGDEITLEWSIPMEDQIEKKYPVNIKYSDIKVSIDELEEPEEIDPFDDLTVTYNGFSPYGTFSSFSSSLPSAPFQMTVYERFLAVKVAVYTASPVTAAISGLQDANT